jgi:hypothetical protein
MTATLTKVVSDNIRKDKLIERALKMLDEYAINGIQTYLCLVNPKPNADEILDWTIVQTNIPEDEQEAIVTRRVIAGFLPVGCLQRDPEWRMVIDRAFIPKEHEPIYIAFARREMALIAQTLDGKIDQHDGWITPVPWSDTTYPGQPLKPRNPGTVRIDVDIRNRSVRITVEPLNSYLDLAIEDDLIEGKDDEDDAIYVAQHVMMAFEQAPPPQGAVPGDICETYLMVPEGAPKLLARIPAKPSGEGITGDLGMRGST